MILAAQSFNTATADFKSEAFSVLANIAWTHLLHEYYDGKGAAIASKDGRSFPLSKMISRDDCPISDGVRNNLRAIIKIRNESEHSLLGGFDRHWFAYYQACCLNYEKVLCELFGDQHSISSRLLFALQFAKPDIDSLAALAGQDVPAEIEAIDAEIADGLTEKQLSDLEFKFRVVYTFQSAAKSRAHIEFVSPDSPEGKEIRRVLIKHRAADELYPYKPASVCEQVGSRTGQKFSMHKHTGAWKFFKVRPPRAASQPENTNREYCIYHPLFKSYIYSQAWVDMISSKLQNGEAIAA